MLYTDCREPSEFTASYDYWTWYYDDDDHRLAGAAFLMMMVLMFPVLTPIMPALSLGMT